MCGGDGNVPKRLAACCSDEFLNTLHHHADIVVCGTASPNVVLMFTSRAVAHTHTHIFACPRPSAARQERGETNMQLGTG